MTAHDDHNLGFTDICVGLTARFGTRFRVERVGECVTMVGKFEGGLSVMINDCGGSLSSVAAHLAGRAAGFYVGIHRAAIDPDGVGEDLLEQVGYACDPEAPPTVEAIGELVDQALAYSRFLRESQLKLKADGSLGSLVVERYAVMPSRVGQDTDTESLD